MYSVKVRSNIGSTIRYVSFDTYSSAISFIQVMNGTAPGRYDPEDYFQAGEISCNPIGELVSEKTIETDLIIKYLYKGVDC